MLIKDSLRFFEEIMIVLIFIPEPTLKLTLRIARVKELQWCEGGREGGRTQSFGCNKEQNLVTDNLFDTYKTTKIHGSSKRLKIMIELDRLALDLEWWLDNV